MMPGLVSCCRMPSFRDAIEVLKGKELYGVTLTKASGKVIRHEISWTQVKRCAFGNTEIYLECTYTGPKGEQLKVFAADKAGGPPDSFNTSGYKGMLHLGILNFEMDDNPIGMFLVIHPKDWYPYQHRFKTDTLTSFIHSGAQKAIAAGVGAKAGPQAAAAGRFVAGAILPSLMGDYLHYLG